MHVLYGQTMSDHHWWHPEVPLVHEPPAVLMKLYCLRMAAAVGMTCLWVMLTLATGWFSVSMVIPIGLAVGNAHHLLSRMPCRAHHGSAVLLTLCGGVIANVLAGLALYSWKMGVDYWQVLSAHSSLEELSMLCGVFVESCRPEDGLFYFLAVAAAMLFAHHLKAWHKRAPVK